MEVTGTSGAGTNSQFVEKNKTGFAGLTADDFMRMLITQLQNQDPTDPMGNDELLSQLATMQNLQSNVELANVLTSFTSNQQLTAAANFIGKTVTGRRTSDQREVTGIADRAFLKDGETYIGIGSDEIALSSITGISQAA